MTRTILSVACQVVPRLLGLCLCGAFLLLGAPCYYLSFDGNGVAGFWIGVLNVLVVHLLFTLLFHASICLSLRFRPFVVAVGGLLSCNAAYFANVRQELFDQDYIFPHLFLYWIPLVVSAVWVVWLLNRGNVKF